MNAHDLATVVLSTGRRSYTTSSYFQNGSKLVRFSNHLPKSYNIAENNKGLSAIMLVFSDINESETTISKFCEALGEELDVMVEYVIYDDEIVNAEHITFLVNNFLNN